MEDPVLKRRAQHRVPDQVPHAELHRVAIFGGIRVGLAREVVILPPDEEVLEREPREAEVQDEPTQDLDEEQAGDRDGDAEERCEHERSFDDVDWAAKVAVQGWCVNGSGRRWDSVSGEGGAGVWRQVSVAARATDTETARGAATAEERVGNFSADDRS